MKNLLFILLTSCTSIPFDAETRECIELRRSVAHAWPIDDSIQLEEEIVQGCL